MAREQHCHGCCCWHCAMAGHAHPLAGHAHPLPAFFVVVQGYLDDAFGCFLLLTRQGASRSSCVFVQARPPLSQLTSQAEWGETLNQTRVKMDAPLWLSVSSAVQRVCQLWYVLLQCHCLCCLVAFFNNVCAVQQLPMSRCTKGAPKKRTVPPIEEEEEGNNNSNEQQPKTP